MNPTTLSTPISANRGNSDAIPAFNRSGERPSPADPISVKKRGRIVRYTASSAIWIARAGAAHQPERSPSCSRRTTAAATSAANTTPATALKTNRSWANGAIACVISRCATSGCALR